jgi:hypothetical protein
MGSPHLQAWLSNHCKTFEEKADAKMWAKEIETNMSKGIFVL